MSSTITNHETPSSSKAGGRSTPPTTTPTPPLSGSQYGPHASEEGTSSTPSTPASSPSGTAGPAPSSAANVGNLVASPKSPSTVDPSAVSGGGSSGWKGKGPLVPKGSSSSSKLVASSLPKAQEYVAGSGVGDGAADGGGAVASTRADEEGGYASVVIDVDGKENASMASKASGSDANDEARGRGSRGSAGGLAAGAMAGGGGKAAGSDMDMMDVDEEAEVKDPTLDKEISADTKGIAITGGSEDGAGGAAAGPLTEEDAKEGGEGEAGGQGKGASIDGPLAVAATRRQLMEFEERREELELQVSFGMFLFIYFIKLVWK